MDNFADKFILACTSVALMNNFADRSTTPATCVACYWRVLHAALMDIFADKSIFACT